MKMILILSVLSLPVSANEEKYLADFLEASREASQLAEEGKNCRVVCFPCCYAPRTCEVICSDKKEDLNLKLED